MSGATYVISSVLVILTLFLVIRRPRMGRNEWAGIIISFVVGSGLILWIDKASASEWFSGGNIYLGLDRTNHLSPFCEEDDHVNSNLGVELYIYETDDGRGLLSIPWTHHSGAVCTDNNTYDAIGIRLKYEFNFSDLFY